MKRLIYYFCVAILVCACTKNDDMDKDDAFTLEEASACLLDSDKQSIGEAVEWIKEADIERESGGESFGEMFSKAYDPIAELCSASREDQTPNGRRRSAALAWVLVDFCYDNATGSCAKWIIFAANLGLIEANQLIADPPEKLRGYLLPPTLPSHRHVVKSLT